MAGVELDRLLQEQRRYYRERAGEYEDWWYRRGRYEHGPEADERWWTEVGEVEAALERFAPGGRVLELACGTGIWSERLAAFADSLTCLDASAEVIELARAKVPGANVTFLQHDLFAWEPQERYDVCFFSFWLSHVPSELMAGFWEKVERALEPGGRVFLIDSARSPRASARDHALAAPGDEVSLRRLADGREFNIVKHWFDRDGLQELIERQGWDAQIALSGEFFVYGDCSPRRS